MKMRTKTWLKVRKGSEVASTGLLSAHKISLIIQLPNIVNCEHLLLIYYSLFKKRKLLFATAKSLQSCPSLWDPTDGSPLGSSVPGILQARTLEWVAISFSNAWKWKVKVKLLGHARLLVTPWTGAYQAPPSMGFSRQEYWSGVPSPSPPLCILWYLFVNMCSLELFLWTLRPGFKVNSSRGELHLLLLVTQEYCQSTTVLS